MQLIRLLEQQENFTHIEKSIAEYILAHRNEMGTMKATTIADETFTSKSSVIRFCKKIGCHGYEDFRLKFISALERTRDTVSEIDFDYPFQQVESVSEIVRATTDLYRETAEICYESLSREAIMRAAEWISGSKSIYLYAIGDSYITAMSFANLLMKLGITFIQPMQFQESTYVTETASANDIALIVSYSGKMIGSMQKELAILRKKRCRTILLSAIKTCPEVDLLINIPDKESMDWKMATFYSQSAFHITLSSLYGVIFGMDYEKNREGKDKQDAYYRG